LDVNSAKNQKFASSIHQQGIFLMKLSVIMPTYNRFEEACEVIDNVVNLYVEDIDLYVVDNSEFPRISDFEDKYREYTWIKFLESKPKSLSAARNLGIGQSTGEWIAFLDDDCIPNSMYFKTLLSAIHRNAESCFFIGRVLPRWNQVPNNVIMESQSALEYLSVFDPDNKEGLNRINWGPSSAMCVSREALAKIGGFAESLGRQGYSILISYYYYILI
jgi:GT2 family glycosyltransferase